MNLIKLLAALCAITLMASGCGRDEEPAVAPSGGAEAQAPAPAGVIEIDGRTWNVVADVQCSVMPGPVVSIAGHAAEDEAVEIVIDYNGAEGPTGVSVTKPDGTVDWTAYASMNFQIERKRVQGAGYFTGTTRGVQKQAEGRFDVDCR
ncbi:MAG: hypothetical protein CL625_02505 [Arenimonas sp.]|nr:hypothetical protein [Arenimonas sp.]